MRALMFVMCLQPTVDCTADTGRHKLAPHNSEQRRAGGGNDKKCRMETNKNG